MDTIEITFEVSSKVTKYLWLICKTEERNPAQFAGQMLRYGLLAHYYGLAKRQKEYLDARVELLKTKEAIHNLGNYRATTEYREWREQVLERDKHKCRACKSEHDLHVHHLNSYAWDEEGRSELGNGIILCSTCHDNFHSLFGRGKNTKAQYENWVKMNSLLSTMDLIERDVGVFRSFLFTLSSCTDLTDERRENTIELIKTYPAFLRELADKIDTIYT